MGLAEPWGRLLSAADLVSGKIGEISIATGLEEDILDQNAGQTVNEAG